MSEHTGISHREPSGKPRVKVLTGGFGLSYYLEELKPVFIQDSNGRGLVNVRVTAFNAVAGARSTVTDVFGSARLLVEDNTQILVTKDAFSFEFMFEAGNRINYVIDLPLIPY